MAKVEYFETCAIPYGFGYLADGAKIHPAMRAYFRCQLDGGGRTVEHPFGTLTTDYFNTPESMLAGNTLVSRFMYGLFLHQKELQIAFDVDTRPAQTAFATWFANMGGDVYGVDAAFVEAARLRLRRTEADFTSAIRASPIHFVGRWFARWAFQTYHWNPGLARRIARMLPPSVVATVWMYATSRVIAPPRRSKPWDHKVQRLLGWVARMSALRSAPHKGPVRDAAGAGDESPAGATLIGYVRGDFGVAQNLRGVAGSLQTVDYPFDIMGVDTGGAYSETDQTFAGSVVDYSSSSVRLYCVNADQLVWVNSRLGVNRSDGRYRIGMWFWELAKFPNAWTHAFDHVDEIWAPSRFIFNTLSKVSPKPVLHMPVAVDFRLEGRYSREGFKLPQDRFLFLFSYDFNSFIQRKNPDAVIAAFLQAFPLDETGVGLVVKTIHGEKYAESYVKLLEMAQEDPRIRIINKAMPRDEVYGLIDQCDCYVSLHRAEGFGLGLAEAMLLGKPVIGTAYSGNMDFMTAENSCLVGYAMVPVPRDAYPYWPDQEWADPNLEEAAQCMERVYRDGAYRARIAALGQQSIRSEHSYTRVGNLITARLAEIEAARAKA